LSSNFIKIKKENKFSQEGLTNICDILKNNQNIKDIDLSGKKNIKKLKIIESIMRDAKY
jgi:hypothetical protein